MTPSSISGGKACSHTAILSVQGAVAGSAHISAPVYVSSIGTHGVAMSPGGQRRMKLQKRNARPDAWLRVCALNRNKCVSEKSECVMTTKRINESPYPGLRTRPVGAWHSRVEWRHAAAQPQPQLAQHGRDTRQHVPVAQCRRAARARAHFGGRPGCEGRWFMIKYK